MEQTTFSNVTNGAGKKPDSEENASQVGAAAANVVGAAKRASKNVGEVMQDEMSNLKVELDTLLASVSTLSSNELAVAKEKLVKKIASINASANSLSNTARQQFNHGMDATGEYVKERPFQSITVAAGIGILLGMLIARR